MGSDFGTGLIVAVLSMVGTLLALGVIALLTGILGRYLHDPVAPAAAAPKVPSQKAAGH